MNVSQPLIRELASQCERVVWKTPQIRKVVLGFGALIVSPEGQNEQITCVFLRSLVISSAHEDPNCELWKRRRLLVGKPRHLRADHGSQRSCGCCDRKKREDWSQPVGCLRLLCQRADCLGADGQHGVLVQLAV